MTIKKRLFISNILMIVIPLIISVVTVGVSFLVLDAFTDGSLMEAIRPIRPMPGFEKPYLDIHMFRGPIIMIVSFIVVLLITNSFLTRFVFRKIRQPLEMLSGGVRQISEGNLDYRIEYNEDDEFKPVCEDFNDMAARLKTSTEEVQKNEENRKELIASISHDLLSPLTSIKGFVEGLRDGVADTPETQLEYINIINQKTDDIKSMVSQLFFYSKIDMGSYPVHLDKLNISDELYDFILASCGIYLEKGLSIEVGKVPDNNYINADPVQLRSVFANILDNSAKYKDKENAKAIISCTSDDGKIKIVFDDDGPGIPEEMLPRIFDVFYRVDPSRSNPHKGSGLGLAIAAKALERMNGEISAENIPGGGLRLIIVIPEVKGELSE